MARGDKDKKNKNGEKKGRGGFGKLFGRKSSVAIVDDKKEKKQTPESDHDADQSRRKSKLGGMLKSRKSSAVDSRSNAKNSKKRSSKQKTKASKQKSKNKEDQVLAPVSIETSYSRNKPRKKKTKKKPKKKPEIIIKRGDVKRVKNDYFPGPVSFKYVSPPEEWVEYLGRKPEVNDYGNGARLILDETDNYM